MATVSNLQTYSLGAVYITTPDAGTKRLSQGGSVTIKRSTNSQPVHTLEGYSGESPGSAQTEITVESAVPDAGFEFDPGDYIEGLIPIKFTIFTASSSLSFDGFIITDTLNFAADAVTKLSWEGRGSLATWDKI